MSRNKSETAGINSSYKIMLRYLIKAKLKTLTLVILAQKWDGNGFIKVSPSFC